MNQSDDITLEIQVSSWLSVMTATDKVAALCAEQLAMLFFLMIALICLQRDRSEIYVGDKTICRTSETSVLAMCRNYLTLSRFICEVEITLF